MNDAERAAWQDALDLWGVRLSDPVTDDGSKVGAFAWFGFPPQVSIDVDMLRRAGGLAHLTSVYAHEVGHHVLSPSTRIASLKLRHQMARTVEACDPQQLLQPIDAVAAHMSNLWSDLLINVHVARAQGLRAPDREPDMVALWRTLQERQATGKEAIKASWWVAMRAYEHLWSLLPGSLCPAAPPRAPGPGLSPEIDAMLVADTVRTFAADPVTGALPFGMAWAPYLVAEEERDGEGERKARRNGRRSSPMSCAEAQGAPAGADELAEVLADPRLQLEPRHPADSGDVPTLGVPADDDATAADHVGAQQSHDLSLTLALYGGSDETAVLAAWYESRARLWIRPLQETRQVTLGEDLPGPLETWESGEDPDLIDWPATLRRGRVVPGVTTLRRTHHPDEIVHQQAPVRLDLYIDSSGSMPRPDQPAPAVLAGTILALSVLRGGGKVRVTSFSGQGQVAGGSTFTANRIEVMRQLTTYYGGGTTFPLDLLAARYLGRGQRPGRHERHHLVVLSDDGLVSMFGRGQEEYGDVAASVRRLVESGTLVLEDRRGQARADAEAAGYDVLQLDSMDTAPAVCAALAKEITRA